MATEVLADEEANTAFKLHHSLKFFLLYIFALLQKHISPVAEIYSSALGNKAWVLDQEQWTLRRSLPMASFDQPTGPASPPKGIEEECQ